MERRIKRGWIPFRVVEIRTETPDTKTLILEDAEEGGCPFDYEAGQYLTLRFDDLGPKPLVRSYTMSSSPVQTGFVALTVKEVHGGIVSHYLTRSVRQGQILRARGPIGKFCYFPAKDTPRLLMTAGGSGVTPFVSILREMSNNRFPANTKMMLVVSHRTRADLICGQELLEMQQACPQIQVFTTLTREDATHEGFFSGHLREEMLEEALGGDWGGLTVMSCGPQALMGFTSTLALAKGVPPERVKVESFEN